MSPEVNLKKILIIDFGSQFTQLIARRVRELGVYSQIISHKKINDQLLETPNINFSIDLDGSPGRRLTLMTSYHPRSKPVANTF